MLLHILFLFTPPLFPYHTIVTAMHDFIVSHFDSLGQFVTKLFSEIHNWVFLKVLQFDRYPFKEVDSFHLIKFFFPPYVLFLFLEEGGGCGIGYSQEVYASFVAPHPKKAKK